MSGRPGAAVSLALTVATSKVWAWRTAATIASTTGRRILVLSGDFFDVVDHQHLDRHLLGLELQAKLLRKGRLEDRNGVGGSFAGLRRTLLHEIGEIEFEIVAAF